MQKKKVNRSYFFLFKWKVHLALSIQCAVSGPARIPTASGKKQPFEADVSKQVDFMTFSRPSSYWLTAPAFFLIASSLLPQSSLTLWRRRRNVVMGRVASLLQVLLLGWLRRACCVDLTCRLSKRIISLAASPQIYGVGGRGPGCVLIMSFHPFVIKKKTNTQGFSLFFFLVAFFDSYSTTTCRKWL